MVQVAEMGIVCPTIIAQSAEIVHCESIKIFPKVIEAADQHSVRIIQRSCILSVNRCLAIPQKTSLAGSDTSDQGIDSSGDRGRQRREEIANPRAEGVRGTENGQGDEAGQHGVLCQILSLVPLKPVVEPSVQVHCFPLFLARDVSSHAMFLRA
jgi:hypothetical protein